MIYLVLAALIWGSSFPTITYTLRDISPMLFVSSRFVMAFLILTPRFRSSAHWRELFSRDIVVISIPNAVAFGMQFRAQELTTASKTALFVNSSPVFVVILSALVLKDRIKRSQYVATAIAMAGVVITSTRLHFSSDVGFQLHLQ